MLLETELQKYGLRDKEAAVYVAMLQLGPSSVQNIARKARIARATTYVVLEELKERGLVMQYIEKRKILYVVDSPERLLDLLEEEKQLLDVRYENIQKLIPTLQAILRTANHNARVEYYRGKEGLQTIRNELARQCSKDDTWHNITSADHIRHIFGEEGLCSRGRIAKKIHSRTIFTTISSSLKERLLANSRRDLTERKFMELSPSSLNAGITLCRDVVAIGFFTGALGGIMIHSQSTADLLKLLFEHTWNHLE